MARWLRQGAGGVAILMLPTLVGCRSIVPLDAATRWGDRRAAELVLALDEPCTLLPGGTPMGRPDGVRLHTLPAGHYSPKLEDDAGIYFESPLGVTVTEPPPRGTRAVAGGIYVAHGRERAWEYLGDEEGVSTRQPLPERCRFRIAPRQTASPPAPGPAR